MLCVTIISDVLLLQWWDILLPSSSVKSIFHGWVTALRRSWRQPSGAMGASCCARPESRGVSRSSSAKTHLRGAAGEEGWQRMEMYGRGGGIAEMKSGGGRDAASGRLCSSLRGLQWQFEALKTPSVKLEIPKDREWCNRRFVILLKKRNKTGPLNVINECDTMFRLPLSPQMRLKVITRSSEPFDWMDKSLNHQILLFLLLLFPVWPATRPNCRRSSDKAKMSRPLRYTETCVGPQPADTNLLICLLREVNVYILSCATEPGGLP